MSANKITITEEELLALRLTITRLRQQAMELPYYSQAHVDTKILEGLLTKLERAQEECLRRLQRAC